MSKIRSKNTKIEVSLFRELRKKGIYFKKHYNRIQGKPDIAVPRKKIAIFIDGDFWHGYRFYKRKKLLPRIYWQNKIEQNINRDKRNRRALRRMGWRVLRIWEHEINKDIGLVVGRVSDFILD